MMPILPNTMRSYTGTSPAYAGSSPYAVPDQPPFSNTLSRQHSQWRSPSVSTTRSRNSRSSTRKPSLFTTRSSSTSSSYTGSNSSLINYLETQTENQNLSRSSSTSSTGSIGTSIKEFFHVPSREERAVRKAEKERQKKVQRAEDAAYRRAQDMEATAMYMAWRYGEGPNTVSFAMY